MGLEFRLAKREECDIILYFIKELADYEKLLHEVVATKETLEEWIFDKQKAEVLIGSVDGVDVGFSLFFSNFSTFLGRSGLYLEDLFVLEQYRGHGYGKAFLQKLAKIAVERGYGRFEWVCLDWNKPSIDFYMGLGAKPQTDWTIYRLAGDDLLNMAK